MRVAAPVRPVLELENVSKTYHAGSVAVPALKPAEGMGFAFVVRLELAECRDEWAARQRDAVVVDGAHVVDRGVL